MMTMTTLNNNDEDNDGEKLDFTRRNQMKGGGRGTMDCASKQKKRKLPSK